MNRKKRHYWIFFIELLVRLCDNTGNAYSAYAASRSRSFHPLERAIDMHTRLSTVIAILMIATSASAATINVPADQPTIHDAIAAAAPGDIVFVADGTYAITSTINLPAALTLQGQSEAGVILQVDCGSGYGVHPSTGGVTLQDFTIEVVTPSGIYAGYAIHASGTPDVQDGLTVRNVTIQGAGGVDKRRAGLDIHGYDNVVLDNVTSKDATWGNGIQITGCANVTVDNCTTTNNAWGSLAIYCSQYLVPTRASSDVAIDGATCVFNEGNVFIENEFGLTSTGITVAGYDYEMRNDQFRAGAENFIFLKDTLADCAAFAAAAFVGVESATLINEIATGAFIVEDDMGMSLLAAIAAADAGGTVVMQPGTYAPASQVTLDKALTLRGAGSAQSTIDVGGFNTWGIYVNASDITLEGFAVLGDPAVNQQYTVHTDPGIGNLVYTDISVSGSRRTAMDLNGVDGATLTDITVNGATSGFGFAISSSRNITVNNLTAIGNAWGAVGVFPANTQYQLPGLEEPTAITFGGTLNLDNGGGAISVQDGALASGGTWTGSISNDAADMADVTVPASFSHVVHSNRADGLVMHNSTTQAAAHVIAPLLAAFEPAGTFTGTYIEDLDNGDLEVVEGLLIQDAIDAAAEGDVITVAAGAYAENVVLDKGVSLLGANADAACDARGAESQISPASGLPVSITADGATLNGFEVTTAAYTYGVILSGTSDVSVEHNYVHDINASATPVISNTYGIYYNVPNAPAALSNVSISDNCLDNIASSNLTGNSAGAIAVLQSTSTGTLSGLTISGNTITNVNVNTGSWPTGKIAYGMILNTGSSSYLTTTGKIVDAVIENNVIDGLSGFISTGIGLEGNTENAIVRGNSVANLFGAKVADRSGGGYDLNGLKFESNRYVGTVTVENNVLDRASFNHDGTLGRGYAVANYVPVDAAYAGGVTGPADVRYNWLGTANAAEIADSADLLGAILNKVGAVTLYDPWLGQGSVAATPATSGPINCGQTQTLTVGYTPDAYTAAIRGYSVTLSASAELSFTEADITNLDPFAGLGAVIIYETIDNGDGTVTVDCAIAGATAGLTAAADLFSVVMHPEADGDGTLSLLNVVLRDVDNNDITAATSGATVSVDCTAPPAAADLAAAPAGNAVSLSWTMADASDVDHFELWRAVWHDGDNSTSAYPEFDDVNPATPVRAADRAGLVASAEWSLVDGAVDAAATSYSDSGAPRGVYWYELVAIDAAGNAGPLPAANDRATNYFLGDFDLDGEVVGVGDITALGSAYGTADGDALYNDETDIGPTDDASGTGIPSTDSEVGFEDLMIFALNYDTVGKAAGEIAVDQTINLAWVQQGAETWSLQLVDACSGALAIRVSAEVADGAAVSFERGELLDSQQAPGFLANDARHGLDLGLASLGAPLQGTGELLRVTVAGAAELAPKVSVFGVDGSTIEVALKTEALDIPNVLALRQNFPNPFNPMTTIAFDLPTQSPVKITVYGIDGRVVRTLVNDMMPAGRHDVVWNGTDDGGRQVASGLYFCRLNVGGELLTRKMTLMK
jgi:hypothetical protein